MEALCPRQRFRALFSTPQNRPCVPRFREANTQLASAEECALAQSFGTKKMLSQSCQCSSSGREGGAERSASLLRYKTCRDMFDSSLSSNFLAAPPVVEWCVPRFREANTQLASAEECALAQSFGTKKMLSQSCQCSSTTNQNRSAKEGQQTSVHCSSVKDCSRQAKLLSQKRKKLQNSAQSGPCVLGGAFQRAQGGHLH